MCLNSARRDSRWKEEHKRQELEEASRLQFRAPFLEPESEAVHADEAAQAGSGECQGQVVA